MGGRGASGGTAQRQPREMTLAERIAQARREAQEYRNSQTRQTRESQTTRSDTATQSRISNYVSEQVGVDLSQYRDSTSRGFDPKDGINVDWKRMPETVRNRLRSLSTQNKGEYQLTLEQNGAWMKLLRLKRRR